MKIRDYIQLMKPSLSIMVVFSSVISYLLAPKVVEYDWLMILLLFVGGMLVTGSANAINQVVERDTDAQMKRTASRPIASGRLTPLNGWIFSILSGAVGVWILGNWFNWSAALLAAFSLFLYAFIYTPLKKVNSIAVLMGAVPGALPCLIGWVAGQDEFSLGGWILFAFQFFWQFPHFWAIAWVAHQDYSAVGFRLLPSREGPTRFTAMQTIAYSLLLVPVTLLPFYTGMSTTDSLQGLIAIGMVILANVFMIGRCINLYRTMEVKAARRVMFGSYLYLPLILFALLLSKATTA
ncbi:MAG: heme o synthase [Sphingomonadales bacterium]